MNGGDIFAILETEPTDDKKEIKRAYAKLVKKYHPEEYPEKWKEIHDAYEAALARAERDRGNYDNVIPSVQEEKITAFTVQKTEAEKAGVFFELPEEKAPEPVIRFEKPETPAILPEQKKKPGEFDDLFDNIGALSRERKQQDREMFKQELQEVIADFRKISGQKELDLKEWETFFEQETKLPYFSTREFLEILGNYFENRTIEKEAYRFLKEQLAVIAGYIRENGIVLQNIGLFTPVDYAEKKIYDAYVNEKPGGGRKRSDKSGKTARKTVWIILIIVGIIIRSYSRHMRQSPKTPEIPELPKEVMEDMMADNTVEENEDVVRTHIPMIPDKIQIGDAREIMVENMGEPDQVRESQENGGYEEAVYLLSDLGDRVVVVLENEIITDIYVEYELE